MNETALELCPVASSAALAEEDETVTEMDPDEEAVPVMMYPMSQEEAILGLEGHELTAASETEPSWPETATSETELSWPETAVTLAKLEVLTIVACSLCGCSRVR